MREHRYPIAAAARLSGLSPDLIRKWELRYQLVAPERDPAGVRRYRGADIERLKLARAATAHGHPIRSVAQLSDEAIAALLEDELADDAVSSTADAVVRAALAALRADEPERLRRTLLSSVLLVEPRELVLRIFVPLLQTIGELWHDGAIAIWQEHLLSEVVGAAGALLTRLGTPQHRRCDVLFATPPGEQHAFGIGFAAMLATGAGFGAHNLGPNLPPADLVDAAARLRVRCVVVAVTAEMQPRAQPRRYLRALETALPRDVALWVGGAAGVRAARELTGRRIRTLESLDAFAGALEELR